MGINSSNLNRFYKMDRMYQLACSIELPDDVASFLRNKEAFPFTNVERCYNSPHIREVLGLSRDLKKISDRESFETLYKTIITDISRKNEDSRTLDDIANRERYAQELTMKRPTVKKPIPITVDDMLKQKKTAREEYDYEEREPKKRSKRLPTGIIPKSFAFRLNEGASLRRLCNELKKLPIKNYPNSSAISFRVFLEKSLRIFLKMRGIKALPYTPKPHVGNNIKISEAPLGLLLEYISNRKTNLIDKDNTKRAVRTFKNSPDFPSLSALNSIIHNEEQFFSPEQARILWPPLERLFIIMLSQLEEKNGSLQNTAKVSRRKKQTT